MLGQNKIKMVLKQSYQVKLRCAEILGWETEGRSALFCILLVLWDHQVMGILSQQDGWC